MTRFFYIARDRNGAKVNGSEEAASQDEVISHLQAKGLIVINVILADKNIAPAFQAGLQTQVKFKPKHYGVRNEDLVLFCRQLATVLGAGVTILKSLEIISQQVASRRLYNVIKDLQRSMESGLSFHEAMARHPTVFSELWINLVESGEASGNMALILSRLASYLERSAAFRSKIVSALIYPVILMVVGFGALLFLTIKIIPTFAELFKSFHVTLPLLTRILVAASAFVRKFFLLGIIAAVTLFIIFKNYISTKGGRRKFENFLFSLPVFGEFFRVLIVERFTSEMFTLVESGVPILYSLEIAEHSVGNLVMADIIHKIKEDVRQGKPLSEPLEKSGFFDPMVVQMVNIGEEIGELPNMFERLNLFFKERIETFLGRLTSMFEPIMLIFMGVIIGIMVIGMFLPIFQIAQLGGR